MAKKAAVIQIVAEGADKFNNDMNKSANAVRRFGNSAKGSASSFSGILGALGKMAPAIGAVTTAMGVFNKACKTNQAIGDEYARVMASVNTTIDNFFAAISNADFSAFNNGISAMIAKARDAQDALDQLGNSTMSLGIINAKEDLEFQRQLTIMKEAKKGSDEYTAALEKAAAAVGRMNTATGIVKSDQWNAIASNIAASTGLSKEQIKFDWVIGAQTLDATADRDAIKKKAAADVQEYQKEYARLDREYSARKDYTYMLNGVQQRISGDANAQAAYEAAVAQLNDTYGESIVIMNLLNTKDDEQLKKINDLTQAYYAGERQIESYRQQLARLGKETGSSASGSTGPIYKMDRLPDNSGIDWYAGVRAGKRKITGKTVGHRLEAQYERGRATTVNQAAIASIKQITPVLQQGQAYTEAMNDSLLNQESILSDLGSAYAHLGDAIGGTAGAVVESLGAMLQATAALIPALESLSIAEGTETAARSSNHWAETIAAIAAVTATVISTFASMPKFEEGGIVGGTSYHGDKLLARLNSGEGVLTAQGMKNLNSLVAGSGNMSGRVEFKIKDSELYGVLRQYNAKASRMA